MLIYIYSINDGISGVVNGIVFVDHEWEVTCRLSDYYGSTEDELFANGLTFRKIDRLEELRNLSKKKDVITFI
ncbi:hypothetical protein P5815_27570 [Bacillus cereus]|uniref:hypothetical protein n=1 Tax=Bacillus cereus TaxID=1396 RepID=UPI002405BD85|nr:hypothetical protein [Bacillus cereus]MDF9524271.1 hypothetical protein [Bacillus cereus]MDF9563050.1 hypothetical protein [Bacillus cereus]